MIVVALGFDFTNGFHDTANAVATSVSTRALSPRMAVLIASVANLAGAFVTTAVAKTIGKDIVDSDLVTTRTVLAALLGAIVWNLLTWWFGLPSSSSHALIGGLVGAALAQSGRTACSGTVSRTRWSFPALLAPLIAFAGAFLLLLAIYWVFRRITPGVANRAFRARAARVGHVRRVHPRRERRAEDDGRDRARAVRQRHDSSSSTFRSG